MAKRSHPLNFFLDRSNGPFQLDRFKFPFRLRLYNGWDSSRPSFTKRIHRGIWKSATGRKQGCIREALRTPLPLFSLPQVFSCSRSLNKLQTDHHHGRLSTKSRIMPSAEEETSQTGSPDASGPVTTLENQPATARRPSAFLVKKVNSLESQVAQILSLLQDRPAGTAPTATTREDLAAPPAPPIAKPPGARTPLRALPPAAHVCSLRLRRSRPSVYSSRFVCSSH